MPGTISEPLEFAPTEAVLAAALEEFAELAERGGGAVEADVRAAALRVFRRASREPLTQPPQWRHDYSALGFAGFEWSSGRTRVPLLPRAASPAADANTGDLPALAVEN